MSDAIVTVRINPTAKKLASEKAFLATKEVFTLDILPAAVEASPVTPEGLQHNLEKGYKRPGGTGTNRRSIDVEVTHTEKGASAKIFTQSGYGGYLETGTSKMRAQPYIYPSFVRFKSKIAQVYKRLVGG
jgi:HK97 gp10 family phage protein